MVRRLLDPTIDITDDERASGASLLTRQERFSAAGLEPTPPTLPTPQPARARRWPGDLAAIVFLLVVAITATWPLARHPASTLPDLGDPLDSAWRLSWPVHQLLNGGPGGLLDANTYYPFRSTYLFDELILGVAIVVAPVVALTGNGVLAFNVALLLAFAMNGIAAYALLRHLTGSQIAAVAGALPFAVAPFRFVHTGHIGLSTAFWLPLALLFLDRLLLRPRWRDAALFGLCAAFQALSAQYYGFQLAIVVGIYLLWAAARRPRLLFNWAFLGRLAFAVVLAELLLLPIVGPYVGVKGTWGYSRGLEENELYSATASSFLAAPPANPIGERIAARTRAALGVTAWNLWLYPGLGALLLALAGAARARRRWIPTDWRAARGEDPPDLYSFFVGLGLFGAAMCLGPTLHPQQIDQGDGATRLMPYRALFHLIPLFDAMRAPERFGNVVLLGLGGAVGFGVAGIVARLPRRAPAGRGKVIAWGVGRAALAALLIAVVGAEYLRAPLRVAAVPPTPPVYDWLAAQPTGPVLELPLGNPPGEANREQVRQYWSTRNWLPRVNGSSDIAPRAYGALRQDLAAFPDPRTLGILQALGVRYIVIHRAQYAPAEWESLKPRLAAYAVTIPQRAEFGDALALELQPDARFSGLQAAIPPGASVFLGDRDPRGTDAYMATLGWLLAGEDRHLITRIIPTYGARYERPGADVRADWLIAYKGEEPGAYGYPTGMILAYEDNVVQVYRR